MKKLYILSLITVAFYATNAQNVGIGTANPETKLQVEGALSLKPSSGTATAGNIEIPTDVSVFRIADDATNTAITVTSASPKEGQSLTIYNSDANTATFYGNTIAPNSGVISCTYVNGAWRLVSDNSASGNNFIKNQTGAQTGANFNISGNGTIGGNLTTTGTATVTGATSLNGGASVSGATNINTSGSSITNIGTGTNTGAITLGNSSNNINLPKLNASSAIYTDASKNLTTTAPNNGTLGYWTRDNANNRLYNSTLTDNVGIGIATPARKFDVAGDARITGVFQESSATGLKIYKNLVSHTTNNNTTMGALVIETNIPTNTNTMVKVRVDGYFYDATSPFAVEIGAYFRTANDFLNRGYINVGDKELPIRLGTNATGRGVIIIGDETVTYQYPKIHVTYAMAGHSTLTDNMGDGWTIVHTSNLAPYSNIVTVPDVTNPKSGGGWTDDGTSVRLKTTTDYVGIGTATPGYILDVSGTEPTPLHLTRTGTNNNTNIRIDNSTHTIFFGLTNSAEFAVGGSANLASGSDTWLRASSNGLRVTNLAGTGTRNVFATSNGTLTATPPAGAPSGQCYTRWGKWGCITGYDEVIRGRTGGQESYNDDGGYAAANVHCISTSATTNQTWTSGYTTRLMRSNAAGNGMQHVDSECSICCSGGCYTALGVNTCATGYTAAYTGVTGTLEGYTSESGYRNETLCIDGTASVRTTWASGYYTRLMRHRTNDRDDQGMQRVNNACAVCCK